MPESYGNLSWHVLSTGSLGSPTALAILLLYESFSVLANSMQVLKIALPIWVGAQRWWRKLYPIQLALQQKLVAAESVLGISTVQYLLYVVQQGGP